MAEDLEEEATRVEREAIRLERRQPAAFGLA
jgi:hypothetical protein